MAPGVLAIELGETAAGDVYYLGAFGFGNKRKQGERSPREEKERALGAFRQ